MFRQRVKVYLSMFKIKQKTCRKIAVLGTPIFFVTCYLQNFELKQKTIKIPFKKWKQTKTVQKGLTVF